MATTVPEPPKIEERRDPSRPTGNSGNGGSRNLVPADGKLPAVKDYSPPPASTGIWVVLASITMSFAAFTSASSFARDHRWIGGISLCLEFFT